MVTDVVAPTPVHPFRVGGRARALWCASRVVRLAGYVAVVVLLDLVALAGSEARSGARVAMLVAGGAVLGLLFLERRLRWHADTHVPGAFRIYSTAAELPAQRSVRQVLPDLVLTVVDAAVFAVGGVLVATGSTPGATDNAQGLVGLSGGAVLALLIWNLVVDLVARAQDPMRNGPAFLVFFAVRAAAMVTWVVAGTPPWAGFGFGVVAVVLAVTWVLGQVTGRRRPA